MDDTLCNRCVSLGYRVFTFVEDAGEREGKRKRREIVVIVAEIQLQTCQKLIPQQLLPAEEKVVSFHKRISPNEPWWQCYTKNPVTGVTYYEEAEPFSDLNLFEDIEDALSHCAEEELCFAVAQLYPHEYPIANSVIPNESADMLYVALPSDAFKVSQRAQDQKQRETYVKRVGGADCALRVGMISHRVHIIAPASLFFPLGQSVHIPSSAKYLFSLHVLL
mgnify:CR=1 FL=1